MDKNRKTISIVAPCWNEGKNVIYCYDEVKKVFNNDLQNYDWELIFANDFSTDDTTKLLEDLASKDPSHVKVINNARNYGVYRSTFNALKYASGDAVVPMLPVDLQDPPEEIPNLVKEWENGYSVVYGMRYHRQEGFILKNIRRLYYVLLNRFSEIKIPKYAGEFQVIDRSVLNALKQYDDYYPFIRGMIANVNSNSKGMHYTWKKREHGKSKHNYYKLYDQGINGLISFSNIPIRTIIFSGLIVSLFSFIFIFVQIFSHFFAKGHVAPPGISTLIVGMFFFFGLLLVFLGVLGEYVAAIHAQVRKGPGVVEASKINLNQ